MPAGAVALQIIAFLAEFAGCGSVAFFAVELASLVGAEPCFHTIPPVETNLAAVLIFTNQAIQDRVIAKVTIALRSIRHQLQPQFGVDGHVPAALAEVGYVGTGAEGIAGRAEVIDKKEAIEALLADGEIVIPDEAVVGGSGLREGGGDEEREEQEGRHIKIRIVILQQLMLGITILIFEFLMIIFFGIFMRTDSTSTSSLTSLDSGLFFTLAFAFLATIRKNLDWTVITNYLIILMLTFQIHTLYYFFWQEALTNSFTSTASISSNALVAGLEATLAIVVTASLFVSRLNQTQIFILCMIEVFAFALNWGICRWGLNVITGGGGITIWLFAYIFASAVRKMRYPTLYEINNARYFTMLLQIIGLVVVIICWPAFNSLMATLDLTVKDLKPAPLLEEEAYLQTWLCLFSCVVTTLGLRVMGEQIQLQKIVTSIINTGILISSSASVIIDPFASLLLGMVGPILCFLYDRFLPKLEATGYPIDKIIMGVLSGIFSAIFCGGRNFRTPALSLYPIKQGGLQFAAILLTLLFASIFGIITGLVLRCTGSEDLEQTDMGMWQISPEILPLYPDDPKLQAVFKREDKERLEQEQMFFSLKQRYLTSKIKEAREGEEQGKIIKQEVEYSSRLAS